MSISLSNEAKRNNSISSHAKEPSLKIYLLDSMFCEAVRTSRALDGTISEDELNEPEVSLGYTVIFTT